MSISKQQTFETVRISRYEGDKKCGKGIVENGSERPCTNTAFLTVKNPDEILYRCWHHSKDSWKEVLESKELFGGR